MEKYANYSVTVQTSTADLICLVFSVQSELVGFERIFFDQNSTFF